MSPRTQSQWENIRVKSKEKILDAALSLFSSIGYFSTSVNKIAQKAGVSKGLLYNYFESKEDLLLEIVKKTFNLLEDSFAKEEYTTPEEELKITLEKMTDMIKKNKAFLKMLLPLAFQVSKFDYINKLVSRKYEESVKKIAAPLAKMGYDSPEDEARIIIAILDGITMQYLTIENGYPFDHIKNTLIEKYCIKNQPKTLK